MKLHEVVNALGDQANPGSLRVIAGARLPVQTSYRLSIFIKALMPHLEEYYAQRTKLVEQYGEKDENGELALSPANEKWKEFVQAHGELLAQELEGIHIPSIDIDGILSDPQADVRLSVMDIEILEHIFGVRPAAVRNHPSAIKAKRGRRGKSDVQSAESESIEPS